MDEKDTEVKETTEPKDAKKSVGSILQDKKKLLIIAVAILIVAIVGVTGLSALTSGKGSSPANLWNGGFAVQKGSAVYYLKFDDGDVEGIYKIGKNGSKESKISSDYGSYLNVDGGYLYFIDDENDNLVRMKTNGKNKETLVKNVNNAPITVNNGWVYYSKSGSFYRVKTNGKNSEKLSNKRVDSYQIEGGWIYYTTSSSNKTTLSKMKLDGSKTEKIDNDLTTPAFLVSGNTIYFIDAEYNSNNWTYTYELGKMKTNGKNKEVIFEFEEELNGMNMTKEGVYYVGEDDEGDSYIYFINYKGKGKKEIVEVESYYSTSIVILDKNIYYVDRDDSDELSMHRIKTNGNDKKTI